jgi:hypothetical protein
MNIQCPIPGCQTEQMTPDTPAHLRVDANPRKAGPGANRIVRSCAPVRAAKVARRPGRRHALAWRGTDSAGPQTSGFEPGGMLMFWVKFNNPGMSLVQDFTGGEARPIVC